MYNKSFFQRGPNKTPVAAIILTSLLTLAFIFIGQVNVLAPIVSINFMLTYSFIDYSYFSVAMTSKLQAREEKGVPASARAKHTKSRRHSCRPLIEVTLPNYGSREHNLHLNGTLLEFAKDMDQIFPPSLNSDAAQKSSAGQHTDAKANASTKQKLMDSFRLDHNSNTFSDEKPNELIVSHTEASAEEHQRKNSELGATDKMTAGESVQLLASSFVISDDSSKPKPSVEPPGPGSKSEFHSFDAAATQNPLIAKFCNHWVALIGVSYTFIITLSYIFYTKK